MLEILGNMEISKEDLDIINKNEGETIGEGIIEDIPFIIKEKGEESLHQIEEEMKKLGHPLIFKEIKKFEWYPIKTYLLFLLVAKNLFNWSDDEIRKGGSFAPKVSSITKMIFRYFISTKRIVYEADNYWKKYYTRGKIVPLEYNDKEKFGIFELQDFYGHPVFCRHLEGFFRQILAFNIGEKNTKEVKEIECVFHGGKCHKFYFAWE